MNPNPAPSPQTGIVATAFPAATDAGLEMLRAGGNAVDAAVAAAWALAVCEPSGSGLGGQTLVALRHPSGRTAAMVGHSRAPRKASRDRIDRLAQRGGHTAATVPTTPATLEWLRYRCGSLSLAEVLAPARRLAEEGYLVTDLQSRQLRSCRTALSATEPGRRFLNDGRPFAPGERFRQPRLALALERIATHGVVDFYEGEIARAISLDMSEHGGLIDEADLRAVGAPEESELIGVAFGGYRAMTIPPPSGGIELLFGLQVLSESGAVDPCDPDGRWHAQIAVATLAAFQARERRTVGPDEWTAEEVERQLDPDRARAALASGQTFDASPGEEGGETTHLCVIDGSGLAVSLTQSIQSLFGAKVANDRFGFLYNNYLTTMPRRRHPHRLQSDGLARSNASPAFICGPTGAFMAIGSAGSRRIVSSMLHCISAVVDGDLSLADAVAVPRVHARLDGTARVERPALNSGLIDKLRALSVRVRPRPALDFAMGGVQVAATVDGHLTGAADPRRDGLACRL